MTPDKIDKIERNEEEIEVEVEEQVGGDTGLHGHIVDPQQVDLKLYSPSLKSATKSTNKGTLTTAHSSNETIQKSPESNPTQVKNQIKINRNINKPVNLDEQEANHKEINDFVTTYTQSIESPEPQDITLPNFPDFTVEKTSQGELKFTYKKTLGYFPRALLYLDNLIELNLSNCGLTYIPDDIDKLSSVKVLDLSNNEIRSVPDSMTGLAYTADKIDLRGNLLCREVPGQMVMEPVLPVDTVEAYQSRMDQEIKTHKELLGDAKAAARAAPPDQQQAAQERIESLQNSNFQIQAVTKYSINAPTTEEAPNILPLIQTLNQAFDPKSGITTLPGNIEDSPGGQILGEGQIYIGTVIKLKITQTEASGSSTRPTTEKHLLFTPLILDTFPQNPENQNYELYQQSIESKQSDPTTTPQPNTNEQAYAEYQSCERLESRIESYTKRLIKNLNTELGTGVDVDNANNYIDAYAELMSICKECKRLNSAFQGKSFPGAEECPVAITANEKFSIGNGGDKKELAIEPLYKKWLVALRIIHADTFKGDNSIEKNALLHSNFANMLGNDAYQAVTTSPPASTTEDPDSTNKDETTVTQVTEFLTAIKGEVVKNKPNPEKNKYIKEKNEEQNFKKEVGQIESYLNQVIDSREKTTEGSVEPTNLPEITDDHLRDINIELRLKFILIQQDYLLEGDILTKDNIKVFQDELIEKFGITQQLDTGGEGEQSTTTTKTTEISVIIDVLNNFKSKTIDFIGSVNKGDINSDTDYFNIRLSVIKFIIENNNSLESFKVKFFKDSTPSIINKVNLGYTPGEEERTGVKRESIGTIEINSFNMVTLGLGLVSHILELKVEIGTETVQDAIKTTPNKNPSLVPNIEPLRNLINNIQLLAKAFPNMPVLQVKENNEGIQKCKEAVAGLLQNCWDAYSKEISTEISNLKQEQGKKTTVTPHILENFIILAKMSSTSNEDYTEA